LIIFVGFVGYSTLKSVSNASFLDRRRQKEKGKYIKEEKVTNGMTRHVLVDFFQQSKCLYYEVRISYLSTWNIFPQINHEFSHTKKMSRSNLETHYPDVLAQKIYSYTSPAVMWHDIKNSLHIRHLITSIPSRVSQNNNLEIGSDESLFSLARFIISLKVYLSVFRSL
jgi:hypothetical protein